MTGTLGRLARAVAFVAALALLVSACTSDPDETDAGGQGVSGGTDDTPLEGSTRGLTDDTIKIGFIGADFGALAEAGIAPDLGDQKKTIQAFVDDINDDGGIAGRQVVL